MKTKLFLVSGVAVATLLSGCVGSGPRTEQGAVTGGTLGAIAGAVIGHNSRGGDTLGGAIIGGVAGAMAGGALGNSVDHREGTIYGSQPQPRYRTMPEPPAPPPPQGGDVMTAPPAPNAIWVPGYWSWDGRGYSWLKGRWEIPPPATSTYVAAHWEQRGGAYVFVQPYWQ
ncbi:MAG: YXWGXW repeat-containing protein [Opitutaceae bacterium]|nr:YXWGXW repeat-containing protein [Opitutaceae bacterium]